MTREGRVIEHGCKAVVPIAETISEKEFMAVVIAEAKRRGWLFYHTFDSRKSAAGFPDLVLVRGCRVIFAELKPQNGRLQAPQLDWAEALSAVGGNVTYALWRPADWPGIVRVL